MAIDYLEDLEQKLERGREIFACPSVNSGDWIFSDDVESLKPKAERAAK